MTAVSCFFAVFLLVSSLSDTSAFNFGKAISTNKINDRHSTILLFAGPRFDRNQRTFAPPPPINENIKFKEVRVIIPRTVVDEETGEETGEEVDDMVGVLSKDEAQEEADKRGLDLVLINENGDPPVCKIIDYGKYKYEADKKKKENAKKQVVGGMKEVKMSYKIDQNDFDVRLKRVQKFLGEGDRVKCVVQFKGREMQHKELGQALLTRLFEPLVDIATMDGTPKMEGRSITVLISPKKTNKQNN